MNATETSSLSEIKARDKVLCAVLLHSELLNFVYSQQLKIRNHFIHNIIRKFLKFISSHKCYADLKRSYIHPCHMMLFLSSSTKSAGPILTKTDAPQTKLYLIYLSKNKLLKLNEIKTTFHSQKSLSVAIDITISIADVFRIAAGHNVKVKTNDLK